MSKSPEKFELTLEERPQYLYARVSADAIDRASAMSYLRKLAGKCIEMKCRRLMIERDIPVMLPDADLFFTTKEFFGLIGSRRIAFVNPYASIEEGMEFAILIGTNRGANYKVFGNSVDAEQWLIGR